MNVVKLETCHYLMDGEQDSTTKKPRQGTWPLPSRRHEHKPGLKARCQGGGTQH